MNVQLPQRALDRRGKSGNHSFSLLLSCTALENVKNKVKKTTTTRSTVTISEIVFYSQLQYSYLLSNGLFCFLFIFLCFPREIKQIKTRKNKKRKNVEECVEVHLKGKRRYIGIHTQILNFFCPFFFVIHIHTRIYIYIYGVPVLFYISKKNLLLTIFPTFIITQCIETIYTHIYLTGSAANSILFVCYSVLQ